MLLLLLNRKHTLYEWSDAHALIYMICMVRRKRRGRPPNPKPAADDDDDAEDEVYDLDAVIFDLILIVDALIFDFILIVQ